MAVVSRSIDLDQDIDTEQACRVLSLSKESIYRLGKNGEIEGFVLCGKRRWVLSSLWAYRERCRLAGMQLLPPDKHRKPGRPRKSEAATTSAGAR